mgnify:CR=1 FL=1
MDIYKAKSFLEEGFLKPLIEDKNITDISFNGREIYYLHNERGRCKSSIIISQNEAKDFLRHLANISEQQFSFSSPILDISFDKYRLTGLFSSIGRVNKK